MVNTLSYLKTDWKVEKVDLSETSLVDWFIEKDWREERRHLKQIGPLLGSVILPEITIQVDRWTTLIVYVLPIGFKVRLSKDLMLGLAVKSTEASISTEPDLKEILQLTQEGASAALTAKVRSIGKRESTFKQFKNVLLPIASLVMFCYFGYLSFRDGETYQPVKSVEELQTVEATLVNVDYQWSTQGQNYKFNLYTTEYPVVFYLSGFLSPITKTPEPTIASIISKVGKAPMKVHIPKAYVDSLHQRHGAIPIYSLTLLNHEYITPQETVRVDVAYKNEQAPFFAWLFPLIGFISMIVLRNRLTGNLLGGV
ncbi:hypothetical protein GU926_04375 [Nibribacter ruber]|uniref:Uncharacterized protein n=1 Tax=Nibribacter ruber TaxID=2698458 RepID=A0A6P1P0X0_9BACT|nr:hypothetical protein [Nibribacter ruber]QHL86712.1 hypothetical protein GU926_04375 [Nibribacter ruber]